jgi:hypothetical protein
LYSKYLKFEIFLIDWEEVVFIIRLKITKETDNLMPDAKFISQSINYSAIQVKETDFNKKDFLINGKCQ